MNFNGIIMRHVEVKNKYTQGRVLEKMLLIQVTKCNEFSKLEWIPNLGAVSKR